MSGRPVIGLPTYTAEARWGPWAASAALLPQSYLDALVQVGAVPLMLPPVPDSADRAVAALDGLVLTGGPDVDPAHYAEVPHPTTDPPSARDDWEFGLLDAALRRNLPTLAVCRGIELINVAFGGSLIQHLPEQVGHDGHRPRPGVFGARPVRVQPGTELGDIVDANLTVPCHHHQAVKRIGGHLVRAAWDADDGTVEALEAPGFRFLVGIQWHPEQDDDRRLFAALVQAAAKEMA